jgi:hypothetical protein
MSAERESKQRVRALTLAEAATIILGAAENLLDDVEEVGKRLEDLLRRLESGPVRTEEARALIEDAVDVLEFVVCGAETIHRVAAGRAYLLEGERGRSCALCGGERATELTVYLPPEEREPVAVFIALCEKCARECGEEDLLRIVCAALRSLEGGGSG